MTLPPDHPATEDNRILGEDFHDALIFLDAMMLFWTLLPIIAMSITVNWVRDKL